MEWKGSIDIGISWLKSMLKIIEDSLENEIHQRNMAYIKCQNTAIEPGESFEAAFGRLEYLGDEVFTAATTYRRWIYGGFIVTALSWLGDILLLMTDINNHPRSVSHWAKSGETINHRNEPPLQPLLDSLVDDDEVKKRIKAWLRLRNRFVHSFGFVVRQEDREELINTLGITFDQDWRMELMPTTCRSLIKDIHEVALHIDNKGT